MTVTNAQFAQLLRGKSDAQLTMLAEIDFAYQTGAGPAIATMYLSDRRYRTGPNESPPNIRYRDVIMAAPTFERSIDVTKLGGRGTMSVGSLTLNNADGSVDFLLEMIIDGREIRFYVGDQTWARADFRLVNVAVVAAVKASNDSELLLELRDKNYLLDAAIIGDAMASGPNVGKPKPVIFGDVYNFDLTPYLFDTTGPTYYFNNYAMNSYAVVNDVRDVGLTLAKSGLTMTSSDTTANAATDTITHASHGLAVDDVIIFLGDGPFAGLSGSPQQYWIPSSGLTANDFKVSLTRGGAAVDITGTTFLVAGTLSILQRRWYVDAANAAVELSSPPAGRVTADVIAAGLSGDALVQAIPHAGFRYILDTWTCLLSSERDSAAFTSLVTAENVAQMRWGCAILDRTNVLNILDDIAVMSCSWYGWKSDGTLSVGKLDLANLDAQAAVDSIGSSDVTTDAEVENLALPWGRIFLDANKNVVVQTDGLANTVSAPDRSTFSLQYRLRVTTTDPAGMDYPGNWWDYHKSAIDSAPFETLLSQNNSTSATAAQDLCDEMTALFKPWTRVYRCTVGVDKYALNPGDCITLTYPRYGLSAGKNVRVMSVNPRFSDGLCDLVLVRQVTPDYTTTSRA